ncbi:MAG: alanine racemase [Eubacterium sp.]|nr:alanine racemase [Eubacterium sp.]
MDFINEAFMALPPHRPTWAEINLDHLLFNLEGIRRAAGPDTKIMGVVKADAYGHGFDVAEVLQDEGVDYLAVAFLDEGIALRQKGIDRCGIFILGTTEIEQIPELVEWDITPAVYQMDFARALSDYCLENDEVHPVHIKLDTGMGRIGLRWDEAVPVILEMAKLPGIRLEGIFTHFATADAADKTFTHEQLGRFAQVVKALSDQGVDIPLKHVENSASIVDFEKTVFNMVRPGIILYGHYPSEEVKKSRLALKPVMAFKTRIVNIKTIHAGDSVSYGRKFIAQGDRVVATLPVGYADGYTRMLSGRGTEVLVKGQRAPVIGNICMDQCMIDITDLKDIALHDEVELFGENLLAEELADRLGTIAYEILCMVNKRVPRVYNFMDEQHLEVEILNDGFYENLNF